MSKKQIHNRLEKLFDEIKEDESAIEETPAAPQKDVKPKTAPRVKRRGLLHSKLLEAEESPAGSSIIRTETIGSTSMMSLPVRVADESWATLQVIDDTEPRRWGEEEKALVQQVADQLSLALENARLFQEVQRKSEELQALNNIIAEASRSLQPDEILDSILTQTLETVNVTGGLISMVDPETGELELNTWQNLPDALWQSFLAKGMGGTLCEVIYSTKKSLFLPDLREFSPIPADALLAVNLHAYIGTPIEARGRALGTLCLFNETPLSKEEGERVETLLQSIGLQVGAALENANLFQQTQQQAEDMEFINRIVSQTAASLDLDEILNTVVKEIVEKFSLGAATIGLFNQKKNEITVRAAYPREGKGAVQYVGTTHPVEPNPVFQKAIQEKQTIVIRDPRKKRLPAGFKRIVEDQGTKLLIVVPIVAKEGVVGLLGIHVTGANAEPLSEREMQIARLIIYQIGTAIENARLFEETQRSLEETATLYDAISTLTEAETYDTLLNILRKYTIAGKAQVVSFVLYNRPWIGDDMPEWAIPLARWSELPSGRLKKRYHLADFPGANSILRPDEIIYAPSIAEDKRFDPVTRDLYLKTFGTKSTIFAPIVGGGQWIGYINLIYRDITDFSEDDIRRLSGIIGQISATLRTLRQMEETQRALKETAMLYDAISEMTAAENYDDLLEILRKYTVAGEAQLVTFALYDRPWIGDDMPEWAIPIARWADLPGGRVLDRYNLKQFGAARTFLRPDQVSYAPNLATDERFDPATRELFLKGFGAKSTIFAPIIGGGQWIGYISIIYRDTTDYSEEDIRRLNGIVGQMSATLRSIRQREILARRALHEKLIREASATITESVNLENVLKNIARSLAQTFGASHTRVRLRPPATKQENSAASESQNTHP